MTVQDTRDPRDPGAASGSNARVLVGVLCVGAVLACVVMPLFGWIVAFTVAIRFAILARRAVQPSLFRVAGWAMVALGLVNVAVIAVLWSGPDQGELTRNSGLGLNLPGVTGVDQDDYRSGLALSGEQLAQREAELATSTGAVSQSAAKRPGITRRFSRSMDATVVGRSPVSGHPA